MNEVSNTLELCSQCNVPLNSDKDHGPVPLQWEQSLAPPVRCFSCFKREHSNELFHLLPLGQESLKGVSCALASGSLRGYFRDQDLISHFEWLIKKDLRAQGYEEPFIEQVANQMACDFRMHTQVGIIAFTRGMIPFYWLSVNSTT